MITINLTPVEELENPLWWIADAASLVLMLILSVGSVYYYIALVQADIDARGHEKSRLIDETAALTPEVEKFDSLNIKITALDSKKSSLKRITESKLRRYLPIILLENIQNLKPEGVWLQGLTFVESKTDANDLAAGQNQQNPPPNPQANAGQTTVQTQVPAGQTAAAFSDFRAVDFPTKIEIIGSAMNNVIIADFMMALKATQNQLFEKSDLRTQLFFSGVGLDFSQITTDTSTGNKAAGHTLNFKLRLNFRERDSDSKPDNAKFSEFIDAFKRDGYATMN